MHYTTPTMLLVHLKLIDGTMLAMGNFNRGDRGGRPSGGRSFSTKGGPSSGWERRGFSDRGSRGPVEMHQAICDNCGKSCEVPFRPTSGKPIFCSNCFEANRGSDSRRPEGRSFDRSARSDDRQMFDAVCDECGNPCKVPFQPSGGKPVFCSNCFGEKKGAVPGGRDQSASQPQFTEQFQELNNKLDKILMALAPNAFAKKASAVAKEMIEEVQDQPAEEQVVVKEKAKPAKPAKKKSSKKK